MVERDVGSFVEGSGVVGRSGWMPPSERGAEAAPQDHQRHSQRHRQQNSNQDADQDGAVLLGLVSVNVQTPQVRLALS